MKAVDRLRFNALAGYARAPYTMAIYDEVEYATTEDERVLGMIVHDRIDDDFGGVLFGRDERLRFRAIGAFSSLPTMEAARAELERRIEQHAAEADAAFVNMHLLVSPEEADHLEQLERLLSQRLRILKRIEEAFGWGKTVGTVAKTMLRSTARVGFQFTLNMAAYNLARLPKLLAA